MISVKDIAWAAGFLEGEGSFSCDNVSKKGSRHGISVQASQVQVWPLMKLKEMFGGTVYPVYRCLRPGQSLYHRWRVSGSTAASVAMTLYVLLSPKRQDQVKNALRIWRDGEIYNGAKTHCPRGHRYDTDNTLLWNGGKHRVCRTCENEKAARKRASGETTIQKRIANGLCPSCGDFAEDGHRQCSACLEKRRKGNRGRVREARR